MKLIVAGATALIILSAVDTVLFNGRYVPAAVTVAMSVVGLR